MKIISFYYRVLFSVAIAISAAACKEDRVSPIKRPTTDSKPVVVAPGHPQFPPSAGPSPAPVEPPLNPAELRQQFEVVKKEAFAQLQPVIRRFDRKKTAYEISEKQYLEKLYLWTLAFSMLEARSNPGTFAGDLPEHEVFPFSDFAETAESLLSDLNVFLERYAEKSDPEIEQLLRKRQEASDAVALAFPGTGSRLQDAIVAMRSAKFKAVVESSNPRLAELAAVGGTHVVNTVSDGVGKAIKFLDAVLNSGGKK